MEQVGVGVKRGDKKERPSEFSRVDKTSSFLNPRYRVPVSGDLLVVARYTTPGEQVGYR